MALLFNKQENPTFTAIILSFKRPQNVQKICEVILSITQVGKLILSNNNPQIDLLDFININDERFVYVTQECVSRCSKRYEIALYESSTYYFCIDDDLFLQKNQIEHLMAKLLVDPSRPHGFWGQRIYIQEHKPVFITEVNSNRPVDILNRAYFFTKDHVLEFFRLIGLCGAEPSDMVYCDDILLSFSGSNKPIVHNIGNFLDCPTSNEPGIASWKEDEFESQRINILKKIFLAKSR